MELMDCSVKQYLEDRQDNKLSFLCQISLCSDISEGLAFLHAENIIHRDLCDDNVLLAVTGDTPTAKIADFGMSRLFPIDYMGDTLTGLAHGQVYLPSEAGVEPYDYNHTWISTPLVFLLHKLSRLKLASEGRFAGYC